MLKKLMLWIIAFAALPGSSLLAQDITGDWQGTLEAGQALRIVIKITKADPGGLKAVMHSIDQGGQAIPVSSVTLQGSTVKMSITAIGGSYEGKLSADGTSITGTWTQANPMPFNLKRVTPETEWAIPEPPPKLKPMAADANPVFEVATIKPGKPGTPGKLFGIRPRKFLTVNTTLSDLIKFSYGVHSRQIIGAPDWLETEKYDLDAQPDGEGQPNEKQWKAMVQKLLAERFKLAFHHDKKELTVYAIVVARAEPKLTKSEGDPDRPPGLFFTKLGVLNVRNATMTDFAGVMQSAVLDRPVVDQSELPGKYDFVLTWTPDETQFSGLGVRPPPPAEDAAAAPDLFTALQEQLGLKFKPTKAPVDVLVIDHVEKPSAN
jgi:uncharacterized protein (TIGR03435 family)